MSGSLAVKINAETYKWDGVEWSFWCFAPVFKHNLVKITGMPRSFVWLYNAERKQFLHAVVHPASPYVGAVKQVLGTAPVVAYA